MIGSAWVASICTSNWNGNIFRIDLLHGHSVENVLNEGVGTSYGDGLRIDIDGDTITFYYTTLTGESAVLGRSAIARYRLQNGHVIRQAPIAPSFGGFIAEWLDMDEADAARWSSPEAAMQHHDVAASFKKGFEWEHAAACAGPTPAREIAVRWNDSKQLTVFLISGTSATEMRMLSVSDKLSPACREIDIGANMRSIMAEPSN
jgi:hypothetical protein